MARDDWHLKYRPLQLEDLVGQSSVVNTLKQASRIDRFANSYFLVGIKGSGKTSTARILANLLTCENPKDGRVCGECIACRTIPSDVAMDVIELDGAANGKVEHITALIDGARWNPSQLKRKVYIIDEAHRLSGSAVSALLKITEDPPSYLNFIFCTTDPDKVIDTITSRSQRFNFRRLLSKEIVGRLRYISEKESVNITDDALFILAKKSRGSMRDAIVSLEQISVLAGSKEITGAIAQKYFGMADRQIVFQIIEAIVNGNIPLVMDQVNDLIMSNVDTKEIAFEISEAFRNIMILKANNGDCKWLDLPECEVELLKKNGENIKLAQLDKLAKQFSTLRKELEFSINERWVLESTLIHCTALLRKQ
jgi:DNA polymerase-3 subunit gamma/tau